MTDKVSSRLKFRADSFDAEKLRSFIIFDPQTGKFIWRIARKGRREGSPAGSLNKTTGYITLCIGRNNYQAHRLAWLYMTGKWPDSQIDHVNGKRCDNRWENLRLATNQQNQGNRKPGRKFKGVYWHGQIKRWRARIGVNGTSQWLGCFMSEESAAKAYDVAAKAHFGEFARLNFRDAL